MIFEKLWAWFSAPGAWTAPGGIWQRLAEHLAYSGLVLALASLLALQGDDLTGSAVCLG